jgi:hypothetical protein
MNTTTNNADSEDKALNLNLVYFEEEDLFNLLENEEFSSFIITESYKRIKKALEEKLDKIELFTISNLMLSIEAEKNNFKPILDTVLEYFAKIEEYKKCSEVKNLIEKYKL